VNRSFLAYDYEFAEMWYPFIDAFLDLDHNPNYH